MLLQSNSISHWLATNPESALSYIENDSAPDLSPGIPPLTVSRGEIFIIQQLWQAQNSSTENLCKLRVLFVELSLHFMLGNGVNTLRPQHKGHDWSTHLPLDIMTTILQTIFSDAFLLMKSFVFWLEFHWRLLLRVQLTTQHWFR